MARPNWMAPLCHSRTERIFLDSSRARRNTERDARSSVTRIRIADSALRVDGKGPQRPAAQNCSFGACGSVVCTSSWQAHLELGHPLDRVVHLTHSQAEPVPEKPELLAASPGDQFFDAPGVRWCGVVHGSSVPSVGVGQVNGIPGSGVQEQNVLDGCRGSCRCW